MNTIGQPDPTQPSDSTNANFSNEDRKWAAMLHLAIFSNCVIPVVLSGLIILIIIKAAKDDMSAFLNQQWKEAINFNITVVIYFVISIILCVVLIGLPLLFLLLIYSLVVPIIATIKVLDGQDFRYPYIIRLV